MASHLSLRRLRVTKGGRAAYDQAFHGGLNIIRGENGSGKSTIADFIFYVLGGELDRWKQVAGTCDEVQAEVAAQGTIVTIRRGVGSAQTKPSIFFGPWDAANASGLDAWMSLPIRRQESAESYSQIMFRSIGIPEAPSLGGANITMHQVLRLLYSDQRTPAAFLFRYEDFDRKEIRQAVGDLVCGLSIYEVFDIELKLRDLRKDFDDKSRELTYLFRSVPNDEKLFTVASIAERLQALDQESIEISSEIERVDDVVDAKEVGQFARDRRTALTRLGDQKTQADDLARRVQTLEFDLKELTEFIGYLRELKDKIARASDASDLIGAIEFAYCPACLAPLDDSKDGHHCIVCGSPTDPERDKSMYLSAKLDIEIQLREATQLEEDQSGEHRRASAKLKDATSGHIAAASEFATKFDLSNGPRESFLAERNRRLGQLEQERRYLDRLYDRASEIEQLSNAKASLQSEISGLEDRLKALESGGRQRRASALTLVSRTASKVLSYDLPRQEEFRHASTVSLRFDDNSITVDGELNFSDSSNVILKNTAILSLLQAARLDAEFNHPRFALFDNIEDKGMEQARSHNFQRIIASLLDDDSLPAQVIITTSMIAPELDNDRYTVGPAYSHERRTLSIG